METGSAFIPHPRVQSDPGGKSLTKQAFKDEVDINQILRKHEKGLITDHLNVHQGDYGDFIDAPDYHTALNRINDAREAFLTVPAAIRSRFDNDPAAFLAFVQDADNLPEMREMGLANPEAPNAAAAAPPLASPASRVEPTPADPPADPPAATPADPPSPA